jgi:hypothetical protein
MMRSRKLVLSLSVLTTLCLSSFAFADDSVILPSWSEFVQVREAGKIIWQLEIENDSLLMNKDDRFYTSGNHLQQSFVRQTAEQSTEYGWRIGQDLYTSSDIKLLPSQLARNDHPYAGWLYAGVFGQKTQMTGRSWRWSVDAGCLDLALAVSGRKIICTVFCSRRSLKPGARNCATSGVWFWVQKCRRDVYCRLREWIFRHVSKRGSAIYLRMPAHNWNCVPAP